MVPHSGIEIHKDEKPNQKHKNQSHIFPGNGMTHFDEFFGDKIQQVFQFHKQGIKDQNNNPHGYERESQRFYIVFMAYQ